MQDILIRILPIILGLTFVAIVLMLLFDSDGWISKPPIINNAPLFSLIVALLSLFVTIMINKELTRIRRIENSISISINEVALKYNLRGGNLNTNLTYSLKNLGKKQALDVTALICIIKSDSSRNPQPKYQKWIDDQKSILTIDESLIRTFSFGNPFEKFYLIVRPQWYNEFFMEQQPTDENQDRIFYCESQYDEDNQIGGMVEIDAAERKKIITLIRTFLIPTHNSYRML